MSSGWVLQTKEEAQGYSRTKPPDLGGKETGFGFSFVW